MKRLNDRTVELTVAEDEAKAYFDDLLDAGHGIPFAAKLALNRMALGARVTHEFADYLSDGTVERRGKRWHVKPEWQD